MDDLIKKVFDKHGIQYADVKFDQPPFFANYVDDSFDAVRDAIIEIVTIKIAEVIISNNKFNPTKEILDEVESQIQKELIERTNKYIESLMFPDSYTGNKFQGIIPD